MHDKQIARRNSNLLTLLLLFLCLGTCLEKVDGQSRINGPSCVVGGSTYTYNFISTGTSGTYSIIHGISTSTGTSNGSYSGSSFSINITWNSGMISGQVAFVGTGGSPSASLVVSTAGTLVPGTISPASQTINYNTIPATINSAAASGGTCSGSYLYQWQQSTDNVNFTNISGATAQNLSFSAGLTQTTYYRNLVSVSGGSSGYSNTATVIVYPQLVAGNVSPSSTTSNYNGSPGQLSLSGVNGGSGSYTYQWQSSPDNSTWTNVSGATASTYTPAGLTATIYYRVAVTSNGLTANSGSGLVTVYPALVVGSVSPASQTLNYNTASAQLSASGISGGNGSYTYQWQNSPNNSTWTNISGATATTYSPGNLTVTTYYHLVVTSNGASLTSTVLTVTVYPQLVAGSATPASQSINYNTVPAALSLSGVSGGNSSYSYQWQGSPNNSSWTNISGATTTTYSPSSLTNPANYYHVLVTSNGITATSSSAQVTVYPLLQAGSITPATQTINYNTNASAIAVSGITGGNGTYSYQWQASADNVIWASISGATSVSYTPLGLTSTTYYRLAVTSNGYTAYSPSALVNVTPPLTAGVITPAGISIAAGTSPGILSSAPATGGTCSGSYTYQWQSSPDGTTWTNITGIVAISYIPGNLSSTVYYRVQVTCGASIAYSGPTLVSIGTINSNLNYVRVRDLVKPGITDTVTADLLSSIQDVRQTTQYFDGLGRPVQTVAKLASPLQKDMVTVQVYDPLGREAIKYLPYTSPSNDGNFKSDPLGEQSTFNTAQFSGEQFYYGRTVFEASPLNRPVTSYSPGISWVGGNRGVSLQYLVNTLSDSVRVWTIAAAPGSIPVTTAFFLAGSLYENVTADEAGHQVVEYKDQQGKVILKKVQLSATPGSAHVGWLNTYYVYDDLNNLRFVLQPRAVELINNTTTNWVISQAIADELCFRYEYDYRKRTIIKKVPGAGETWMVYDSRDRLVLSQDAHLRTTNQWLFSKYDNQNRPVMTGLYTDATHTTQSDMQTYLATQNMGLYETYNPAISPVYSLANSFPAVTDETTVRNYTFYDDYLFGNWYGTNFVGKDNSYDSQFPAASASYPYPQAVKQNKQTRGLVTGVVNKKMNNNSGLIGAMYYDDRGRVIQKAAYNYSMGIDVTTTQYSFSGQPLQTVLRHQKSGTNAQTHTVTTLMNYSAAGRLLSVSKAISSVVGGQTITKASQTIVTNTYNELGQLQNKNLGSIDNVAFDYNIRGWLTGINKSYLNSPTGNYFGMQLAYDNGSSAAPGTYYSGLQYNGNIAGTIWKSAGDGVARKYAFSYDAVNRLTGADFNQYNGSSFDKSAGIDFSVSGLNYDANGNILSMKQVGFKVGGSATIDSLIYSYMNSGASNKLAGVTDGANDQNSKMGDFHYNPTTKGTSDYTYDNNGSLVTDNNKGISSITYNYLNLPQNIPITGKGNIAYIYDAAGTKLVKTTVDNTTTPSVTTVTAYMAGFVYVNDTLQFMGEEEGRARWAFHKYKNGTTAYGWEHDFFEKDHLGNTRVLLTQQKDTTSYIATMEGAYRANENALFYNIPATAYARASVAGYPVDTTVTKPNDSVARVNGSGPKVGPAIILKVMSGDKVDIGANYYYNTSSVTTGQALSSNDVINSLATGIVSLTGGAHGSLADLIGPSTPLTGALTSFINAKDGTPTGNPNAYLNWILLDDQFNYVSASSGAQQVTAAGTSGGKLQIPLGTTGIPMTKSGYLYIYVSNATPGWDVFFDNLSVTTYSGPMLEETHYYPFGLTMSGISDKALKAQYAQNRYRYNGKELQNQEFSDGTGLEEYDYGARMQDPQLGVWHGIDPLADNSRAFSPYAYAFDNPTRFIDRDGMAGEDTQDDGERLVNYMDVMDKSGTVTRVWAYADNTDSPGDGPNTEASTGASIGDVVKMDLSGAAAVSGSFNSTTSDNVKDRPSYDKLMANYMGDGYSSKDVYDDIGGKVKSFYFRDANGGEANSCALRLSRALNKSGFDIDRKLLPNAFYVTGGDGKDYLLRVKDMVKYLSAAFGQPDITKSRSNQDIQPSDFNNQKGIIGFEVNGWSDASGHVTLFNGSSCAHDCYFQKDLNAEGETQVKTAKVMLWILK